MREHFHNPLIPHSHIVPHGFCRMNPLPVFIGDSEPLTIKLYDARHCNNFLEMKKKMPDNILSILIAKDINLPE